MKAIRLLVLPVFAASVCWADPLASTSPIQEGRIGPGRRVAAVWEDGAYYLGTVIGGKKARYKVLFEDGDRHVVDAAKVKPLSEDSTFRVGDRVVAAWRGIRLYPGVVAAVHPKSCLVKWDDGDQPTLVTRDRMFVAGETDGRHAAVFRVGDRVMAEWKGSSRYPGVVAEVKGSTYLVKWDDGDEPLWVEGNRMERTKSQALTATATFKVGDRVMAKWKGEHRYPGVVAEVRGDRYLIQWDDGDQPLLVTAADMSLRSSDATAAELKVGDPVMATWKNSHKYPGVVIEVRAGACLIRWDDGDEPMWVANDQVTPRSALRPGSGGGALH